MKLEAERYESKVRERREDTGMDGIKRNLLYWGYTIGQMILAIVVMVLVIGLMTEVGETGNILLAFCVAMSEYGAMYMPFMMGILGMTVIGYMPLTLSMGSTRRDSFTGMEIMLHLEGLLLIGIIIAADIFSGKTVNSMLFFGSAMRLAASAALCNLVGWAYLRFGKVISLILYIVLVIVGALGVSVFSILYAEGRLRLPAKWGEPALVAVDCIVIWLYAREVKKMEVRV